MSSFIKFCLGNKNSCRKLHLLLWSLRIEKIVIEEIVIIVIYKFENWENFYWEVWSSTSRKLFLRKFWKLLLRSLRIEKIVIEEIVRIVFCKFENWEIFYWEVWSSPSRGKSLEGKCPKIRGVWKLLFKILYCYSKYYIVIEDIILLLKILYGMLLKIRGVWKLLLRSLKFH